MRSRRVRADALLEDPGCGEGIRMLADKFPQDELPAAVAAVLVGR